MTSAVFAPLQVPETYETRARPLNIALLLAPLF
jgi:hypothetical protein